MDLASSESSGPVKDEETCQIQYISLSTKRERSQMRTDLGYSILSRIRHMLDNHVRETSRGTKELSQDELEQGTDVHPVRSWLEGDAELVERQFERLLVFTEYLRIQLV